MDSGTLQRGVAAVKDAAGAAKDTVKDTAKNALDSVSRHGSEPERHREGLVARGIEEYTAQLPSDTFLWAAGASMVASLALGASGNKHGALFVGQWAAPFLLLGVYNKLVKVAGSDRTDRGQSKPALGQS